MGKEFENQVSKTAIEAVAAYVRRYPDIARAASEVGLSTEDFVVLLINEIFGIPGARDVLDRHTGASRYGEIYSQHEIRTLLTMFDQDQSLALIADRLGRTVLGAGWKALNLDEVHHSVRRRFEFSGPPSAYDAQVFIDHMQPVQRSESFALCVPQCDTLLSNLDNQLRFLSSLKPAAKHNASNGEPATPDAFQQVDLLNRLVQHHPVGQVSLWLNMFLTPNGHRLVPVVLQGEDLLLTICEALGWFEGRPSEVVYDLTTESFTPTLPDADLAELTIDNFADFLIPTNHFATSDARIKLHSVSHRQGFYDVQVDQKIRNFLGKITNINNALIPVGVVIGGDEHTARELLQLEPTPQSTVAPAG